MSYEGQIHHPHTRGEPPNQRLIAGGEDVKRSYVPNGLELLQAHWIIRHGERSAVWPMLAGHASVPHTYNLCASVEKFSAKLPKSARGGQSSIVPTEASVIPLDKESAALPAPESTEPPALTSECNKGELTDTGRESTFNMGKTLRSLYVDKLHFLPSQLSDIERSAEVISLRCTGITRTQESLHHVTKGLYPKGNLPSVTTRPYKAESLFGNPSCARYKQLHAAFMKQADDVHRATLESLDPVVGPYINNEPLRIHSDPPCVSGVVDVINVCNAHGIEIPDTFKDAKLMEKLESAKVQEWFGGHKESEEYSKLAGGRMLGDLADAMKQKIVDPIGEQNRLALYAAHDVTIGIALGALQAFDDRWPPFTSHISFELFRKAAPSSSTWTSLVIPSFLRSSSPTSTTATSLAPSPPTTEGHYVRLRYNGKPLRLPACQPAGKHLEGSDGKVCTFEAFREAVARVRMSDEEWFEACKVRGL